MKTLSTRVGKETLLSIGILALSAGVTMLEASKITEGAALLIGGIAIIALRGFLKNK
jgi:hypothetical protein